MFNSGGKKSSKKGGTRPPEKPAWITARLGLLGASGFFASLSVVYWMRRLWDVDSRLAIFVGIGFGVSALVTPAIAPRLAKARGWAFVWLLLVTVVFNGIDSFAGNEALNGIGEDLTRVKFEASLTAYNDELASLKADIDAKTRQRDALPSSTEVCIAPNGDPYGPQNCAERREGLADDHARISGQLEELTAAKAALVKPVHTNAFAGLENHILILAIGVQIALAVGFIAIDLGCDQIYSKEMAEYESRLAVRRADRLEREKEAGRTERAKLRVREAQARARAAARAAKDDDDEAQIRVVK